MRQQVIHAINWVEGKRYETVLLLWVGSVLLFASIYYVLPFFVGQSALSTEDWKPVRDFWSLLYFSFITATSTGYGDIIPVGIARFFASFEAFTGLLLFATFISKLLSRQEETMLTEMHRLAFRTEFHNVREDLYVARKDLDRAIADLSKTGSLVSVSWTEISVALQQISRLMQEVPEFFEEHHDTHALDTNHERLLKEAVERTLMRVADFCEIVVAKTEWDPLVREDAVSVALAGEKLLRVPHIDNTHRFFLSDAHSIIARIHASSILK